MDFSGINKKVPAIKIRIHTASAHRNYGSVLVDLSAPRTGTPSQNPESLHNGRNARDQKRIAENSRADRPSLQIRPPGAAIENDRLSVHVTCPF